MATGWRSLLRQAVSSGLRSARRGAPPRTERRAPGGPPSFPARRGGDDHRPAETYPGDFDGVATIGYDPRPDGRADPGEVVWGWVPFEEDHSRGKDRPALVVGSDGPWVLALMLTSKDHDQPARRDGSGAGRDELWHDIGSGGWDQQGRPSEVRLDRVLRLDPDAVRREGGHLDRARFDEVAARLRSLHGWT